MLLGRTGIDLLQHQRVWGDTERLFCELSTPGVFVL